MSNISGTPPKRAKQIYSQTEVEKSEINTQTESRAEAREAKKQKPNTTHNREPRSVRVLCKPRGSHAEQTRRTTSKRGIDKMRTYNCRLKQVMKGSSLQ